MICGRLCVQPFRILFATLYGNPTNIFSHRLASVTRCDSSPLDSFICKSNRGRLLPFGSAIGLSTNATIAIPPISMPEVVRRAKRSILPKMKLRSKSLQNFSVAIDYM